MRRGGGQESSSSSKKRGGGKTIINWSVVVLFTDFVSLSYRCHLPSNFLMLSDRFFAMYCNQLKWKSLLHWCKHKCYFFFGKPKKAISPPHAHFGVNITQKIWRRFSYLWYPKANKRTTPFLLITKMTVQPCKSRELFSHWKYYVCCMSFFFDGIYCFCW